jgi:hypothetical protein
MANETLQLERLVDDPEIRRAAAKTLKGFCLTYLTHHFPADLSDFLDEMSGSLENHDIKRLEIIGFRGCAKSTMASLALVLWAALEHPDKYPFIIMLADTRGQASINSSTVQHELRDNELILKDYGHLKYRRIDDPRPEPTLESDEDWQVMNCVLDNGVRILSRSRGQKIRGLKRDGSGTEAERCTWKAKYPTQEAHPVEVFYVVRNDERGPVLTVRNSPVFLSRAIKPSVCSQLPIITTRPSRSSIEGSTLPRIHRSLLSRFSCVR